MSVAAEHRGPVGKGGAVYKYSLTLEVERVDALGQIEEGVLEGKPRPVQVIELQGLVRSPASPAGRSKAVGRAMHDAANRIAKEQRRG